MTIEGHEVTDSSSGPLEAPAVTVPTTKRERLLATKTLGSKDETIWNEAIRIQSMTAAEQGVWMARIAEFGDDTAATARILETFGVDLFMATVYDPETNEKLFDGDEDRAWLSKQDGGEVMRIAIEGAKLSGLWTDENSANFAAGDRPIDTLGKDSSSNPG